MCDSSKDREGLATAVVLQLVVATLLVRWFRCVGVVMLTKVAVPARLLLLSLPACSHRIVGVQECSVNHNTPKQRRSLPNDFSPLTSLTHTQIELKIESEKNAREGIICSTQQNDVRFTNFSTQEYRVAVSPNNQIKLFLRFDLFAQFELFGPGQQQLSKQIGFKFARTQHYIQQHYSNVLLRI